MLMKTKYRVQIHHEGDWTDIAYYKCYLAAKAEVNSERTHGRASRLQEGIKGVYQNVEEEEDSVPFGSDVSDITPAQVIELVMDQFQVLYTKAACDAGWDDIPQEVDDAMAEAYRILRVSFLEKGA